MHEIQYYNAQMKKKKKQGDYESENTVKLSLQNMFKVIRNWKTCDTIWYATAF